jgi:hypothetical protein
MAILPSTPRPRALLTVNTSVLYALRSTVPGIPPISRAEGSSLRYDCPKLGSAPITKSGREADDVKAIRNYVIGIEKKMPINE